MFRKPVSVVVVLQEPPERPKRHDSEDIGTEKFQLWTDSGESCPEGTIPIRRTTETDVLRARSVRKFGKKLRRGVRRNALGSDHEVSIWKYGSRKCPHLHQRPHKRKEKKNYPVWRILFFV